MIAKSRREGLSSFPIGRLTVGEDKSREGVLDACTTGHLLVVDTDWIGWKRQGRCLQVSLLDKSPEKPHIFQEGYSVRSVLPEIDWVWRPLEFLLCPTVGKVPGSWMMAKGGSKPASAKLHNWQVGWWRPGLTQSSKC